MSLILKIWSVDQSKKKIVLLKKDEDFVTKVASKFGLLSGNDLKFAFQTDGTEIDDFDYEVLKHFSDSGTTITVLVNDEKWVPNNLAVFTPEVCSSAYIKEDCFDTNKTGQTILSQDDTFSCSNALKAYLAQHPNTLQYMNEINNFNVNCNARQHIVRVVMHKMVCLYGNYPNKFQKSNVAVLLGETLGLPSSIFYDPVSYNGYLDRALENARRKLLPSAKKHTWSQKREAVKIKIPDSTVSRVFTEETEEASCSKKWKEGCPRGLADCMICGGVSNIEDVDKLRYLASIRVEEIKRCTQSTFCLRQTWVADEKPVLSTIIKNYPKFALIPELIDIEFSTKYPICKPHLLDTFLNKTVQPLYQYCGLMKVSYLTNLVNAPNQSNDDWRVYNACKMLCYLLRKGGKQRKSAPEIMEHIMICNVGESIAFFAENLENPYPVLLIQGQEGETILSINIAYEKKIINAGKSITEGIDRMLKLYWCFNIQYDPISDYFWQFIQTHYDLDTGKKPKCVIELLASLLKYTMYSSDSF
ncbi:uncharacterized protein LOC124806574 isoform X1 [Hydra vulgaris]|uniref:uncharacterized protein LOC124806574 isoform X1 n=1 Tax=Hydra vulgaris TaxID=6087 RepID=UPI000641438C|nr:uncharacterized protein LOC124806574 isoform X1 [Hydra vulgaris]